MQIEDFAAASTKVIVTTATGMTLFGMTVGDFGVGAIGVATIVFTAFINLYSKFKDERRYQIAKDMEVSKDSWIEKFNRAHEENQALKGLLETHRQEITMLQEHIKLINQGFSRGSGNHGEKDH